LWTHQTDHFQAESFRLEIERHQAASCFSGVLPFWVNACLIRSYYFFGGLGGGLGGTGTPRALISVFMLGAFPWAVTTAPGRLIAGFECPASKGFEGIITCGFSGCF
jgi:hypothetical protein